LSIVLHLSGKGFQTKTIMKSLTHKFLSGIFVMATLVLLAPSSKAVGLSWSAAGVDWTPGNLTQSFDVDSLNAGNDVTVTISGNTFFHTATGTNGYVNNYVDDLPAIMTDLGAVREQNNGNPGDNTTQALQLFIDSWNTLSESITVTMAFNYAGGVTVPTFNIYDIDFAGEGGFQDEIRAIYGITTTGGTVFATINSTGTNAGFVTVTGTSIYGEFGTADNANSTGLFSFAPDTRFTSISFVYGSGPNTPTSDPGAQWVALSDINWNPVPEVGTALGCLAVCGGLIFGQRRRQRAKN